MIDSNLNFDNYQISATKTAIYPMKGSGQIDSINYCVIGLAGEVGELVNKWKKVLRTDKSLEEAKQSILEEGGDILWYLSQLATELKASLGAVAKGNLEKLQDRMERKLISGDGDRR